VTGQRIYSTFNIKNTRIKDSNGDHAQPEIKWSHGKPIST